MQVPDQSMAHPLPLLLQPMVGVPKKPAGHVAVQLAPGIVRLHWPIGSVALVGTRGSCEVGQPAGAWGAGSAGVRKRGAGSVETLPQASPGAGLFLLGEHGARAVKQGAMQAWSRLPATWLL